MSSGFAPHWARWFNKKKASFTKWHWIHVPHAPRTLCGREKGYYREQRRGETPPASEVCAECAEKRGGLAAQTAEARRDRT